MGNLEDKSLAELEQGLKEVGWSIIRTSSKLIDIEGPDGLLGHIHKDVGVRGDGSFEYLKVVFAPDDYEEEFEELVGVSAAINKNSGRNLHAHSGYRSFPYRDDYESPCGKAYRVDDIESLASLLECLEKDFGKSKARAGSLIRAIHLMNFKGIGAPTDIPLKPVTLLFGPNSAGKSTVLHALLYAREILTRRNLNPDRTELGGERVDLGGFENFVHEHNIDDNQIGLGFTLDLTDQDLGEDVLSEGEQFLIESAEVSMGLPADWLAGISELRVSLFIEWSQTLNAPKVTALQIFANGKELVEIMSPRDSRDARIGMFNMHHDIMLADNDDDGDSYLSFMGQLLVDTFDYRSSDSPMIDSESLDGLLDLVPLLDLDDALPSLDGLLSPQMPSELEGQMALHPLAYTTLIRGFLTGLIVGPLRLIRDELNRLTYLGPLRDMPAREFAVPKTPDNSRWVSGLAAWDQLVAADPALLEQVNDWLFSQHRLNSSYQVISVDYKKLELNNPIWFALTQGNLEDLPEEEIEQLKLEPTFRKISLIDNRSLTEVQPHDVGVGISQLLPVIIASLVNRYGLVAVEQPELHIHPAWQVVLGDLFLQQSKENNTTFLIETHSEHLLLRLLKRIRQTSRDRLPEGETPAYLDDVAVLFVGNSEKEMRASGQGGLEIRELRIDENGRMLDEWPKGFFEEAYNETFKD